MCGEVVTEQRRLVEDRDIYSGTNIELLNLDYKASENLTYVIDVQHLEENGDH